MRVIVSGSRSITNYDLVKHQIELSGFHITELVCGGANGVDKFGEKFAKEKNIKIKYFLPDWHKYGKAAGPIRNEEMAKYADFLIAIWDGKSRGTKNMIDLAHRYQLKSFIYILE